VAGGQWGGGEREADERGEHRCVLRTEAAHYATGPDNADSPGE
jgi:hypothetical protein